MASSEDNKAAVREFFACSARGDTDALDAIFSPDYVLHDPAMPEDVRGVAGVKELAEMYHQALGDHRVTIEQQLADGDYVVTRFTCRGRHDDDIMGVPATGRQVAFEGIVISRFRDGKIVEEWGIDDTLGLLRQIGALPEMVEG